MQTENIISVHLDTFDGKRILILGGRRHQFDFQRSI